VDDAVYHELVSLRRGSALQSSGLATRVGPHLSTAGGIVRTDSDAVVRQKLAGLVGTLTADFPSHLAQAINVALAIARESRFPRLEDREEWLASAQHTSVRSARRRVHEATTRLATVLRERERRQRPDQLEHGWHVSTLRAMLRMDDDTVELVEERTIVATRDNLDRIGTRFSLPCSAHTEHCDHQLVTSLLHGARLAQVERLGHAHFRHVLDLPRPLQPGDETSYVIRHTIPPGQVIRPYYAFVPLMPSGVFDLRVRFDQRRLPRRIWKLHRVAPRQLDEPQPGAAPLTPDEAGDLNLHFTELLQGYGYGVAWQPDPVRQ
jgi:hypothetical protein